MSYVIVLALALAVAFGVSGVLMIATPRRFQRLTLAYNDRFRSWPIFGWMRGLAERSWFQGYLRALGFIWVLLALAFLVVAALASAKPLV